jgi:hypothetical protein
VARERVSVRARKGYFAMPPGVPVVRPSELPLVAALERRPPPRDLAHRAAALPLAGGGVDAVVVVKVPLSALDLVRDEAAGVWRGRLGLLGLVRDGSGRPVARLSHDSPLEGPLDGIEAARRRSLLVRRSLSLAPGRYSLETAVQDRASARLGVGHAAFDVPGGEGLSVGALVLVRPEPVAPGTADDDPLRVGDVRGVPRLGDPVVIGEDPVVGVFLSLRPAGEPAPVRLTLEIRQGATVVGRSTPALPPPDVRGRITYLAQFPSAGLAAGRYTVRARAEQGGAEATAATSFQVVAPAPTGG